MIFDSTTTFSLGQAITATAISQNVLDMHNAVSPALQDDGLQGGGGLWLEVLVGQAFNTLTSLVITAESDSAPGLATAPVIHWSSGPILLASLVAGAKVAAIQLPAEGLKRYLGLRYTVNGSNPSQGTLNALFNPSVQSNRIHPNGFQVG